MLGSLVLVVLVGWSGGCGMLSRPESAPTDTPQPSPTHTSKPLTWDDLALTPPMGWNSWNHFACNISEALIRETADAMVSSGMLAAGYQYVNIDDCWMASERDTDGTLPPDPGKFPSGMKALADYVHGKGLKLGIYLDRGTETCGHFPGSYGYEVQDANTIASWGIDYLKYDNCAPAPGSSLVADYINMSNALKATGRPIVFSMCSWGFPGSWVAGQKVAHLWRTTSDIQDTWESILKIMDANSVPAVFAGPGHWNDPDMLEVGNGGMTDTEYRSHFTMWALMAAPLIAGNDLRGMPQATIDILTAPEVITVNQDPLGYQGRLVGNIEGKTKPEVWSKVLSGDNAQAVALLNRSDRAAEITVKWAELGLPDGPAKVRDLWMRTDLGTFASGYTASVPSHGVVLIRVESAEGKIPAVTPAS
ncbi:MAG: glycoside hydrolase family 27 protein [Anaerolineales bacterium]|nr:glycoside hydrolase family 27 protein [Anaerolineales bacterium]